MCSIDRPTVHRLPRDDGSRALYLSRDIPRRAA